MDLCDDGQVKTMGYILSVMLQIEAAARDNWNSSRLLCTSRAQVLATK
jgi:hypothetical protein